MFNDRRHRNLSFNLILEYVTSGRRKLLNQETDATTYFIYEPIFWRALLKPLPVAPQLSVYMPGIVPKMAIVQTS